MHPHYSPGPHPALPQRSAPASAASRLQRTTPRSVHSENIQASEPPSGKGPGRVGPGSVPHMMVREPIREVQALSATVTLGGTVRTCVTCADGGSSNQRCWLLHNSVCFIVAGRDSRAASCAICAHEDGRRKRCRFGSQIIHLGHRCGSTLCTQDIKKLDARLEGMENIAESTGFRCS